MLAGGQPTPPALPALQQLRAFGIRQRIGVDRVELVQRSIGRIARGKRLPERDRTHTRNLSTPTDKSLRHNAIQARLSTTTNPSTDFAQSGETA